ncbi:hypothetical protein K7X08_029770 [Anisodus acutangulus]|uniref:Uncharacterized protein n=1 Tax=Anisodus acutangulus TaxID=402998 RepID=A0A9Q1MCE6_9SOLA|nr:hypothetical protein K7X08_029770 [Anisodus acutangulus]
MENGKGGSWQTKSRMYKHTPPTPTMIRPPHPKKKKKTVQFQLHNEEEVWTQTQKELQQMIESNTTNRPMEIQERRAKEKPIEISNKFDALTDNANLDTRARNIGEKDTDETMDNSINAENNNEQSEEENLRMKSQEFHTVDQDNVAHSDNEISPDSKGNPTVRRKLKFDNEYGINNIITNAYILSSRGTQILQSDKTGSLK